ncbi:MAG: ABC transporter ATP-binding protein [Oscillospiraceae bacterium]|nr:ABC transporter ATP-binding protein [Oscillospiraceae bacterium]
MNEQSFDKQRIRLSTWKTILRHGNHRGKLFLQIILCGMTLGTVRVLGQLLNTFLIDKFMTPNTLSGFLPAAIAVLMVQILYAFLAFGFLSGAGKLESHLTADVRMAAFEKLQTMSFSYYDKSAVGFLISRLTSDVANTMDTVSWCCVDIGFGVMSFLASIVGMLILNVKLALLLLCTVPILAVISAVFQRKMLRYNRERRKLRSEVTSAFNEGIMGAATTKTLVREEQNAAEFTHTTSRLAKASMRAQMASALYLPLASLLISTATAVVLYQGGRDVMTGIITIGELNFFINVANMMFEPIRSFAGIFAEFQAAQAAAERVAEVLVAEPEIQDTEDVIARYGTEFEPKQENWEPVLGSVTFDHVSFRYGAEPVLEDFSLEVQAGQTIALVGKTGSGKSTIVNLLCRFYQHQSGRILIDGVDIRSRSQLWLESSLGYVLQSPHLFSGSIRDNIRYGRLNATDAEIKSAARLVGADSFIEALDQGYDTEVGEEGGLLSTGQKQLISFARAMIADPKIFVLDEATSSIDTETEQQLQEATKAVLSGRTSFVIAHRLSTIRDADCILVIDHGKILEKGTHSQLMAQRGRYYQLCTGHEAEGNIQRSLNALTAM